MTNDEDNRKPHPDDIEEGWPEDDDEIPLNEEADNPEDYEEPYPDDIDDE